jgi:transcriptional regulator with PAS, ATPase and Fis domain
LSARARARYDPRPAKEARVVPSDANGVTEERLGPLPFDARSPTPLADVTRAVRWRCAVYLAAIERARRFAPAAAPVLLHGETGTGKTAFAELVHAESGRAAHPFARVNCAALTPTLLAAELFGHVRGAFTGAETDRPGLLRSAGRGTVLLDEVDKAPPSLQGALLHVLDAGEARPVGSTATFRVEARLLFATNRPLRPRPAADTDAPRARAILPDLHFRIASLAVPVPPVRRRREDFDLLVALALRTLRIEGLPRLSVDAAALGLLAAHDWPGNVRELHGTLRAAALLRRRNVIDAATLREAAAGTALERPLDRARTPADLAAKVRDLEREEILLALRVEAGNQARAARRLGLSRRGLNKKIHRHALLEELEREALVDFRTRR